MLFSAYVTVQTCLLRLTFSIDKFAGLLLPDDAQKISFYHQNVNSVSRVQARAFLGNDAMNLSRCVEKPQARVK